MKIKTRISDPIYTIKAIKVFNGAEGNGFNANLYKGGKKIAELIDDAWGGELQVHWMDSDKEMVKELRLVAYNGVKELPMTPDEAILAQYLLDTVGCDPDVHSDADIEIWLTNLVQYTDIKQQSLRDLKKKAMIFDPETYKVLEFKNPYDEKFKKSLDKFIATKYPTYQIVNTLSDDEAAYVLNYAFFKDREDTSDQISDRRSPTSPSI